jgi:hypothetical protein
MVLAVGSIAYYIILSALFSSLLIGIVGRCLGWSDDSAPIKSVIKARSKKKDKAQERIKQVSISKELEETRKRLASAESRAQYLETRLNYTQAELHYVKKKQVKDFTTRRSTRGSVQFKDQVQLETQQSESLSEKDLANMVTILDTPDDDYRSKLETASLDTPIKIDDSFDHRSKLNDEFRKKSEKHFIAAETSDGLSSSLSSHSSINSTTPPRTRRVVRFGDGNEEKEEADEGEGRRRGRSGGDGNKHYGGARDTTSRYSNNDDDDDNDGDDIELGRIDNDNDNNDHHEEDDEGEVGRLSRLKYNDTEEEMREFAGLGRRSNRTAAPPPKKKLPAPVKQHKKKKKKQSAPPVMTEMTFDI